jgi:hypothetical protein
VPDDLLDAVSPCLETIRAALDERELVWDEDTAHAPMAIALLGRMVFLLEAAVDVARSNRRAAAAVFLRPAVECWIDCCYVLYCKHEAVVQLTSASLSARKKLGRACGVDPRQL